MIWVALRKLSPQVCSSALSRFSTLKLTSHVFQIVEFIPPIRTVRFLVPRCFSALLNPFFLWQKIHGIPHPKHSHVVVSIGCPLPRVPATEPRKLNKLLQLALASRPGELFLVNLRYLVFQREI
jgi:hypothetical protein